MVDISKLEGLEELQQQELLYLFGNFSKASPSSRAGILDEINDILDSEGLGTVALTKNGNLSFAGNEALGEWLSGHEKAMGGTNTLGKFEGALEGINAAGNAGDAVGDFAHLRVGAGARHTAAAAKQFKAFDEAFEGRPLQWAQDVWNNFRRSPEEVAETTAAEGGSAGGFWGNLWNKVSGAGKATKAATETAAEVVETTASTFAADAAAGAAESAPGVNIAVAVSSEASAVESLGEGDLLGAVKHGAAGLAEAFIPGAAGVVHAAEDALTKGNGKAKNDLDGNGVDDDQERRAEQEAADAKALQQKPNLPPITWIEGTRMPTNSTGAQNELDTDGNGIPDRLEGRPEAGDSGIDPIAVAASEFLTEASPSANPKASEATKVARVATAAHVGQQTR